MKLRPFQNIGVDFLAKREAALLADEMGLGKTAQAVVAADVVNAHRILVLCPASLKDMWVEEFRKWSNKERVCEVLDSKNYVTRFEAVRIINYDLVIRRNILHELLKYTYDLLIADESHYLKNGQTQRTKAVLLKGGLGSRCRRKWYLTGTPVQNRPIELYPILVANSPQSIRPYHSRTAYGKRFCNGRWDGFRWDFSGASNLDDLNKRLYGGFMLRREKKDVLTELPEKTWTITPLRETSSEFKKLQAVEFDWYQNELRYVPRVGEASEIALARHQMAKYKVPYAVEIIQDILDSRDKLVVFAYHREVINQLVEKLSTYGVVKIDGSVKPSERQAVVKRFQDDPKTRVFVGQIQAAGVGITLTAASHCVFVETSWVPGDIDQAADRIHRIGQRDNVTIQFLPLMGTVEEHMLKTLVRKRSVIETLVRQPTTERAYL